MPVSLPDDVRDLLRLHLVPGLGPRLTAALLERFGSPAAVLGATAEQLAEVPHIGPKLSGELSRALDHIDLTDELTLMEQHGAGLLALGTAEYPAPLQELPDPPHLLYVRGRLEARDARAVALVGSRHCTGYGRRVTELLARGLAQRGYTVVSGLARGIDGVAHRAALQAGGRTVAVLAGGLSRIYPPEHTELAREVEAAGALLTESSMRMEPMAGMFPARNRLISGLSRAVVIVEAAERSGALITASHAGNQGRPVFAVPGPVDNAASGGTNALIRKGAILVRGVDDILEELEGVATTATPATAEPPPGLDEVQRRVWEFLGERPRHLDEMVQHLALPVSQLSGMLMLLEMRKVVRRLPGNQYERA